MLPSQVRDILCKDVELFSKQHFISKLQVYEVVDKRVILSMLKETGWPTVGTAHTCTTATVHQVGEAMKQLGVSSTITNSLAILSKAQPPVVLQPAVRGSAGLAAATSGNAAARFVPDTLPNIKFSNDLLTAKQFGLHKHVTELPSQLQVRIDGFRCVWYSLLTCTDCFCINLTANLFAGTDVSGLLH